MSQRWCDQCQDYGHRKQLFLGTHRTHRLYMRYRIRKAIRKARRDGRR